jgi:hypothetical protein
LQHLLVNNKGNMNKHLKAIRKKLEGERDEHLADLEVYLTNLVGVGEHPDFGEVIEKKIKKIEGLDSQIDTINKYFNDDQMALLG